MLLVSLCCPDFVSICNVWRQKTGLTVTDRDVWHLVGGMSQSVTSTSPNSTYLLQIETKVGGCRKILFCNN